MLIVEPPRKASTSLAFSLLSESGKPLLGRDALLSLSVLESHFSLNRRGPVAIVGIVVVQCTVVPRVANTHIVGVASVGSAEGQTTVPGRSHIVISLFLLCKKRLVLSPLRFKPCLNHVFGLCRKTCPELRSIVGNLAFDIADINHSVQNVEMPYRLFHKIEPYIRILAAFYLDRVRPYDTDVCTAGGIPDRFCHQPPLILRKDFIILHSVVCVFDQLLTCLEALELSLISVAFSYCHVAPFPALTGGIGRFRLR